MLFDKFRDGPDGVVFELEDLDGFRDSVGGTELGELQIPAGS